MKPDTVHTLYTRRAKFYQRFFVDFLKWGSVLESFFRENGYLHSAMKILDAGCGTGSVTQALYRIGKQKGLAEITYHGFDLTLEMLDIFYHWVREERALNIQLCQSDVLNLENHLPKDWAGYDLIVTSTMLEYIPQESLGSAVHNLGRLLNRDGRMLIFVTRRSWLTRIVAEKSWRINPLRYEDLSRILRETGFTKIQQKALQGFWRYFIMAVDASNEPQ